MVTRRDVDKETFRIFGFAGSLRAGSYNRGLLRAASELLPAGTIIDIRGLGDLPAYNADAQVESDSEPVQDFKRRIAAADALLIATPEYNYSMPGVLKNAIDWASRPPKVCCLRQKPVGIIGASTGEGGTIRAQLALRQVFVFTDSYVMVQPEFRVAHATERFDAASNLVDSETRERLRAFLVALVDWTKLVSRRD